METMSLELQLIRRAITGPRRSSMAVHLMKANAKCGKVNHITCSNILTRKLDLKLPQTQLWNLLKGSLNLQSRHRSSRGFAVRAEAAAGFPVSYESSERDHGGEKMMVKSGLSLSDAGKNFQGFEVRQTGGSDIGNGNNNQGGHGHGGNNGGGDANNNNSGGSGGLGGSDNELINIAWWWVLQCLRMLRASSTMWGSGRPELVWLVERAVQFVTTDLVLSTGMTRSLMMPSVLAVAELIAILSGCVSCFLTDLDSALTVFMSMMLGAFVAVTAGLSWAVLSLPSLWSDWNSRDQSHDENDDENDYCVE